MTRVSVAVTIIVASVGLAACSNRRLVHCRESIDCAIGPGGSCDKTVGVCVVKPCTLLGTECDQVTEACVGGRCVAKELCNPEPDADLCRERGRNCGNLEVVDNCGTSKTVACGTCAPPLTCGGSGSPNVCGCAPESDAALCSRLGKDCGTSTTFDNCGQQRALSCGTCTVPKTCGGGGTPNVCGCTPTTCQAQGKDCGSVPDGCGSSLACGTCIAVKSCGGDGRPNVCGCCSARLIAAGGAHTCALTAAGSVLCWGYNGYGQLGNGSFTSSSVPVQVSGLTSGVAALAVGRDHACAITPAGGVVCWGFGGYGQLGNNSLASSSQPVAVAGLSSGVVAVAAGEYHCCAVKAGGAVQCWGLNDAGQLGDDSTTNSSIPVDVIGEAAGITAITAGGRHTCARSSAGGVQCWGANSSGQLGNGSTSPSWTPFVVFGLSSVRAVSAGGSHTCALTSTTGAVWCWGANGNSQIGDGATTNRLSPVQVAALTSSAAAIAGGGAHTCVVMSGSGASKCWGWNFYGQVGNDSKTDVWTPVDVFGLSSGVSAVSGGTFHTCVSLSGGGVKCWGGNASGQLGDGTATDRTVPVDVTGG